MFSNTDLEKKDITHDITILTIYIRSIFLYSLLKNVSNKDWMFLREIYSDINYVKIKLFSSNKTIYFLIQ